MAGKKWHFEGRKSVKVDGITKVIEGKKLFEYYKKRIKSGPLRKLELELYVLRHEFLDRCITGKETLLYEEDVLRENGDIGDIKLFQSPFFEYSS